MKCFLFFICLSGINSNYSPSTGSDDYFMYQDYERSELEKYAEAWSSNFKIPIELVKAVIEKESSWNNKAYSRLGAKGLMQVMEATASGLGKSPKESLYNPYTNIYYGCKYLRQLLDKFNGNYEKTLMAYYSGPASVSPIVSKNRPSVFQYASDTLRRSMTYMEVRNFDKQI